MHMIINFRMKCVENVLYLFEEMQLSDKSVANEDETCIFEIAGTYPPRGNPLGDGRPPGPGTSPYGTFPKIHFKFYALESPHLHVVTLFQILHDFFLLFLIIHSKFEIPITMAFHQSIIKYYAIFSTFLNHFICYLFAFL